MYGTEEEHMQSLLFQIHILICVKATNFCGIDLFSFLLLSYNCDSSGTEEKLRRENVSHEYDIFNMIVSHHSYPVTKIVRIEFSLIRI